jgi:hypothetical protein
VINARGNVVTNHHVIAAGKTPGAHVFVMSEARARELEPKLRELTRQEAMQLAIDGLPEATVAWSDPTMDLAVLSMPSVAGPPLSIVPSELAKPGDRIVSFGFPGVNQGLGAGSLVVLERKPGEITSAHLVRGSQLYSTNAPIYKGMSGGPVVNTCGEVIAVNEGFLPRWTGELDKEKQVGLETMYLLIQSGQLKSALDANNIPYTAASARCEGGGLGGAFRSGSSRDPVLTGGVFAAIVLGLVSVGLGLTKRGRTAMKAATDGVSRRLSRHNAPPPPPKKAAAPAYVSPRPGPPQAGGVMSPPMPPMQPVMPKPSHATPLLYGVSGEYGGVELELGQDPVSLGRDPRVSHLVFAESPAVSGRHCAVWFDPTRQAVMLEDLWSTNGTFLGDGRRLTGGQPHALRSADQFYLGEPAVLFEVRY